MRIIVETLWRDRFSGELYGPTTHQVVDKNFQDSQKLEDAIRMAKEYTNEFEVALVRDLNHKATKPGVY